MQNNQYTEILNAIFALRDNFEARFDALSQEVGSLKGRVAHIEETMATKEELRKLENRLMGEINPLMESVAYLSEQSASHDRKLFLLKNQQQP